MLQHVHRETVLPNGDVKTDAGLWINAKDYRGLFPVQPHLATTRWKDLSHVAAPEALDENAEVYGHMPWTLPVKKLLPEKNSWYLPAAAPAVPEDQQWTKWVCACMRYADFLLILLSLLLFQTRDRDFEVLGRDQSPNDPPPLDRSFAPESLH